jgi:hypothetical protein
MIPPGRALIILTYLFNQCAGQSLNTSPKVSSASLNTAGVVASIVSGQAITQTYEATSITNLATVTSETSVETTIAGATWVGVVFAGGLAWLIPKPPPGQPIINAPTRPPVETPTIPQSTKPPTTSAEMTSPTAQSSSSSATPTSTQAVYFLTPPTNLPAFQQPITVPDDVLTCGFNDGKAGVDRTDAYNKIVKFCNDKNQTSLTAGPVSISQTDAKIKTGLYLNMTVTQNPECKGDTDQVLDADYCTQFLLEALDSCDTQSQSKFGGTVKDECATYVLQPTDSLGDLACKTVTDALGTGVNRDNALKNIADMCKNGGTVSPNAGYLQEYRQEEGDSNLILQIMYNPTCPRGRATRTIDPSTCVTFFQRLVDDCDTKNAPPFGKYGGNLTDECEVFQMDTSVVELVNCDTDPTDIFTGTPHPVDNQTAQAAIYAYCNSAGIGLKYPQSTDQFVQFSDDTENYSTGLDGWVARMKATWMQTSANDPNHCKASTSFTLSKDECYRKYEKIVNQCLRKCVRFQVCGTKH